MTAAFDLSDAAPPARARTETQAYGVARKPFTTPLPDLADADNDAILDLAANALKLESDLYALCGSSPHVRAVCQQVERLDLELTAAADETIALRKLVRELEQRLPIAQGMADVHRRAYERERLAHDETIRRCMEQIRVSLATVETQRVADLQEVERMRGLAIRCSEETAKMSALYLESQMTKKEG